MLYLNESDIEKCEISWEQTVKTIRETTNTISRDEYFQPIKPYLYFDNPKNRIIAMPARVGKDQDGVSGIKWIASFPDNLKKNILRANSLTVLNSSITGEVLSIINTSKISAIRTASVSGYMLQNFLNQNEGQNLTALIIGFGPIGQNHLSLIEELFIERFERILIFDTNTPDINLIPETIREKVELVDGITNAFVNSDVVITCTTSSEGYISDKPKQGSLHLNVSLRDYHWSMQHFFDEIIVDSWDEVCRANTDIEIMAKNNGLSKEQVVEIQDLDNMNLKNSTVFFNPMGMASFDIAIGKLFCDFATTNSIGIEL
ncbi:2,3-diaminopropionate biosynthesis protein SbnB [Enterococcus termitis]|nr:2,3-diaminopropionate biosynthesis protein SbnB [Enterococcus termitis]